MPEDTDEGVVLVEDLEEDIDDILEEDVIDENDNDGKPIKKADKDDERLSEIAKENKLLRDELMKLSGKLDAVTSKSDTEEKAPEHPLAYLESEEAQDELLSDPKAIVTAMNRQMSFIIDLLKTRDRAFLDEISRRDPEERKATTVVQKLRENPRFKDFTDAELTKMVRSGVVSVKQKQEDDDGETEDYIGRPGGGRRGGSTGKGADARERAIREWEARLGYDRFDTK